MEIDKKASKLSLLPVEIVGQIFGAQNSVDVINLWKTGDKTMQHKLATGVSTISLSSFTIFANRRLPSLLCSLSSLRELSISVHEIMLYSPYPMIDILKVVGPHLTKLVFKVRGSNEDFRPPADTDGATLSSGLVPHATKFIRPLLQALSTSTRLQTLVLKPNANLRPEDVELLPSSLTSLNADLNWSNRDRLPESIAKLPRGLLYYKSFSLTDLQRTLPLLPPNLLSLCLDMFPSIPAEYASLLPRSLTELGSTEFMPWDETICAALPPGLTSLSLVGDLYDILVPVLKSAQILPLKRLVIDDSLIVTTDALIEVPRTVTYLKAVFELDDVESKHWPPGLTSLDVVSETFSAQTAATLPASITRLQCYPTANEYYPAASISYVPRSITSLYISVDGINESVVFPPHLTRLSLGSSGMTQFPLHLIPRSVRYLQLRGIPLTFSDLIDLPPCLKDLAFTILRKDDSFSAQDPAVVAKARELVQEGLKLGVKLSDQSLVLLASNSLTSVCIFDLLPRTLTHLRFKWHSSMFGLPSIAWAQLPQSLKQFFIFELGDPDAIPFFPGDQLTDLTVETTKLPKFQELRLPRHLSSLVLKANDWSNVDPTIFACKAPPKVPTFRVLPLNISRPFAALRHNRINAFLKSGPEYEILMSENGPTRKDYEWEYLE